MVLSSDSERHVPNGGPIVGRTAICYVSDKNFLYGTLLSIVSLQKNCRSDSADIFLFMVDIVLEDDHPLRLFAAKKDIRLINLSSTEYVATDMEKWNKTHVSIATLGRFFIESRIPEGYDKIFYIDGDTLILSDITTLVNYRPPAGTIAAAEDNNYFIQFDGDKYGRKTKGYFQGLGIPAGAGYFNAGLLIADRQDWRRITGDAYDFFLAHTKECLFHDQSALNAVSQGRRTRLSPKWNFHTPFRYWNVKGVVQPAIFHFTEYPKPWMGKVYPWIGTHAALKRLAAGVDGVGFGTNMLEPEEARRLNKQNLGRMLRLQTIYRSKLRSRQNLVKDLLKTAAF